MTRLPRLRILLPVHPALRRMILVFAALFAVEQSVLFAWAAVLHRVVQKDRAFSVATLAVNAGDAVLFTNEDPFLHQIYVDSPDLHFESDEQPPGQTVKVEFPRRGTFPVRCHIHPKMLLTVTVK
ncbi:MAG TPA: cupredoxin domain-containing protein [Stellaceae bacterium]|nr:cupredoxin domain-containing protein [Stellaceae bacterium]